MVKKGQTIGGAGQVQAAPRRGGMLPPSGAGPVEVTPEWLAEQQRADVESAGAVMPAARQKAAAPVAQYREAPPLPDPDSEPADQLSVCERGIHGAKARWKEKVDGATAAFIDEAGPYLCWVHENKLYKLMLDNSGRPYRSFAKYLKEQHGLPRRTGYRITQTIPLLNILRPEGAVLDDLSSRQVAVLHPVRIQHGTDAVAQVWWTASETKKGPLPTPEELEKAKLLLRLETGPDRDADEDLAELTSADPGTAVERAAKLLVPDTVREAVKTDPDRVRLLYQVLGTALTEAGVPVD